MEELDVQMFGISLDDVAAQAQFVEEQKLGFQLLSDPDGSVAKKYGVLAPGSSYASRVTFIVDPKGVLRKIDDKVDVRAHGTALAEMIVQLQE